MRLSKPRFWPAVLVLLGMVIMSLTANSHASSPAEKVLWSFGQGTDGIGPYGGLIVDTSGNLYGTTAGGGAYGNGTIVVGGDGIRAHRPRN